MKAIFLGGDLRQKYACEYLNRNNIDAECYIDFYLDANIKKKIKDANIIALPIPLLRNDININMPTDNSINIYEVLELINDKSVICGGIFGADIKEQLKAHKLSYIDYFDIESFQIQNALLSAEGAIHYSKQRLEKSIHGAEIAVLGFGRIGKILSYLLRLQGAKITVCARKDSDYAWCQLIGFNGFKIKISGNMSNLNLINNKYDLIFNTIPFWIMDEDFAKSKNADTVIIDLASRPFGIDERVVSKYNLRYYRELGIPGRYAPQSAGEIIGQTIINNINIMED